jgi:hypothetical protein
VDSWEGVLPVSTLMDVKRRIDRRKGDMLLAQFEQSSGVKDVLDKIKTKRTRTD